MTRFHGDMRLPSYVKDIYLLWRNEGKVGKHIYLRKAHVRVLTRKTKEFQRQLRKETENRTAAFTLSNLIELMTQICFEEEPEMTRHIIRETHTIKDLEYEQ